MLQLHKWPALSKGNGLDVLLVPRLSRRRKRLV